VPVSSSKAMKLRCRNHVGKSGSVEVTGRERENLDFAVEEFWAEIVRYSAARVLVAHGRVVDGRAFLGLRPSGLRVSRFADIAMLPVQPNM